MGGGVRCDVCDVEDENQQHFQLEWPEFTEE